MNFYDNRYKNRYLVIRALCDEEIKEYKYFFNESDRFFINSDLVADQKGVEGLITISNVEQKNDLYLFITNLFNTMQIISLDDIVTLEIREGDEIDFIIDRQTIESIQSSYSTISGSILNIKLKNLNFVTKETILDREEGE